MARHHHTVIFVPHARARLRKWQITNLHLGLVVGCFSALTLGITYLLWAHFNATVNPAEIARLRTENSRLKQVNQSFESSIEKLRMRLNSSEDRTRQLAILAGLESLGSGGEPGVGGGTPLDERAPATQSRIDGIAWQTGRLTAQLDAVAARLEERVRWISSTPSLAPVRGIVTSGFGTRSDPLTHGPGLHQGVDIAAAPGQPVLAAADGIVVLAATQGGYGEAVYLAHGFGITTRYGHLSEISVRPGQRVRRGSVVGRVGSSGRSTGYHLHYEVRIDGNPVNPLAYILDSSFAG
jgi:murein DD-endopeptidase MepM/ murein hydrolase activator NlpD